MPKKLKKTLPESESGKSITSQLSDLRSENRALKKLFHGQQAQMNEMQATIAILWERIGN